MHNESVFQTVDQLQTVIKSKNLYSSYLMLDAPWKERFVDYMTGKKTMPLTYDPFFKCIFNPDVHPDWLSKLLSAIIGEPVTVEAVLPSEDTPVSVDSLLIMDIIVQLSDGSLANVEIQKIPYQFTAERISCYSSDLLLREYTRLKQNTNFLYSDMKKVYTIVLYEKSSAVFKAKELHGSYIHHGKTLFNTGLRLELLQEYFLISLDVFRQRRYTENIHIGNVHSDIDNLDGWLSILTAETIADAEHVIERYPWSEAIFQEMSEYIKKPEEVMLMFSEALKIADKNTVKYMMDELQEQLNQEHTLRELAEDKQRLAENKQKLAESELQQSKENERKLQEQLAILQSQLNSKQ